MHRTIVKTTDVEKITPLPEDLKKFESLELLITPAYSYKKEELKRRLEAVFKKAKDTNKNNQKDINIDNLMNEMNDALL